MPREGTVRRGVRGLLKGLGVPFYPIPGNVYSKRGSPDFVACIMGRFLGIECKRPKGGESSPKISPSQRREAKLVKRHLGYHVFAHRVEDVKKKLKEIEDDVKGQS